MIEEKWEKEVNIENEQEVNKYETFAKRSHKIDKKIYLPRKKKKLIYKI